MAEKTANKLILRNLTLDDYDYIKRIMDRVYPMLGGWTKNPNESLESTV